MASTDLLLNRVLRRHMMEELSANLLAQAGLAAAPLDAGTFARRSPLLAERAAALGKAASCRLTLIGADGTVLADSSLPDERVPSLENHRDRPEVRATLARGKGVSIRRSSTVGEDELYAAVRVDGAGGPAGVVRLALPLTQVEKRIGRIRRSLAAVTLGLLPAALLASLWLSRSLSRPLEDIRATAERLASGDFSARVRDLPSDEHRQLALTLNEMASRIQENLGRLERLEKMRKDFVANVSHELRTPLSAVKAYAETLASGGPEDPRGRAEFTREIEKNADRMARLVDDLLALSEIESGGRPPAKEPVSLMRVAAEAAAALKPLAERKRIALRVEPFPDMPELSVDRSQVKQVLTNLLDNAVKHTPEAGTVRVWAAVEPGHAAVFVQDTGCGIPAEHLPRIFERFYRVDKSRSREMGGTGLGLAIVKHIVEAHGGTVAAECPPGQGSTFRFTLPLPS
ncbi:MAG: HAMP domain-containing protein [Elusimicrobia bacterium]|nr:HAMP domain-containing protein [Elusimicrobiota bacterium]